MFVHISVVAVLLGAIPCRAADDDAEVVRVGARISGTVGADSPVV